MKISEKKIINAIIFFASKNPEKAIDRLKLMKLLWLSDRIHLIKYGRPILRDKYYAMDCGPVLSRTKDFSDVGIPGITEVKGYMIKAQTAPDLDYFSDSDIEIMNLVWTNYGKLTSSAIVKYSHMFPEWKRFQVDLEHGPLRRYDIVMEDFFAIPNDEYFKSLVNISPDAIESTRHEYRNSNALLAWLNS